MKLLFSPLLPLLALTAAQAPPPSGRPAPAPPAGAPPSPLPLAPAAPNRDGNALISMIKSGLSHPSVSTSNPIVSMIQSGLQNAPFATASTTPIPTSTTTTYLQGIFSFELSNISFASTLLPSASAPTPAPAPAPAPAPEDMNSTPGAILLCTSTTYSSWTGDVPDATCDLVHAELNQCRNVSALFRKKVTAVRPDKGQLCLLFDEEDCFGKAEWVKWPGVRNLRGRLGDGGSWAGRVVSFRCSAED
ncbi:hypothetical protein SVAN01_05708 [Stagonosporopsis vannaccii]|nr:hypothetical protein SVAN01_05708 [Stagonosporopsis vannaccii]